jgi:hypothetical protein
MQPRLWFTLAAITLFANTDVDFILSDNFPAILGISNTLIHARVGLGWSPNSAVVDHKPQAPVKYPGDAVWYVSPAHPRSSHFTPFPET